MEYLAPVIALAVIGGMAYFIYTRITRKRPEPTEEDKAFQRDMMKRWEEINREVAGKDKE
jgi:hypothetical protein